MPRFPLLRLPTLPLLNCIQYLKVFEIIDFSLLSKRTKTLVSLVNWNQPDIHLNFIEDSQICLKFPNDPGLEWILDFESEFDDELNHTLEHRWKSNCKMGVCTLQPSVVDVHIKIDYITAPTLLFILDNIKMTDNFSLNLEVNTPDFEYNQAIDIPTLILSHSHWITLKSILNSSSRVLILDESNLNLHDINTLLKCWLNGSNPQLEYISIRRSIKKMEENVEEAFQIITKDLEVRKHEEDGRKPMKIVLHKKATYQLSNVVCYDIVRDDGTIGTFHQTYFNRSDVPDFKLHYFNFHVWNKKI
ncbi:hypothetical protein CRE_20647 [Caenorhabditis remanei]|uniref:F-box domain-containing protein n=1 Tax=Caenorhabditis remanei TaxID=31234 RepID=E3NTA7_CAERE|nr:hypothetical protein CRE_20647 [Caenorhabditis remanei]